MNGSWFPVDVPRGWHLQKHYIFCEMMTVHSLTTLLELHTNFSPNLEKSLLDVVPLSTRILLYETTVERPIVMWTDIIQNWPSNLSLVLHRNKVSHQKCIKYGSPLTLKPIGGGRSPGDPKTNQQTRRAGQRRWWGHNRISQHERKHRCASSVNGRESNTLYEWSDAHVWKKKM